MACAGYSERDMRKIFACVVLIVGLVYVNMAYAFHNQEHIDQLNPPPNWTPAELSLKNKSGGIKTTADVYRDVATFYKRLAASFNRQASRGFMMRRVYTPEEIATSLANKKVRDRELAMQVEERDAQGQRETARMQRDLAGCESFRPNLPCLAARESRESFVLYYRCIEGARSPNQTYIFSEIERTAMSMADNTVQCLRILGDRCEEFGRAVCNI